MGDIKKPEIKVKPKSKGLSCFGKPKGTDLDGDYKANANMELEASGESKSKGLSCFGKPKGTDLDGEYKVSTDVHIDTPKGDINTELPSADASIAVKSPQLDIKPVKAFGKPKSGGLSCFGKPKGSNVDGDYKATTDVNIDAAKGDINTELPRADLDMKTGKASGKSKSK